MELTGNTLLITGGASGIGRGLADAFARRGNTVVVTARNQAQLDALARDAPERHWLFLISTSRVLCWRLGRKRWIVSRTLIR